MAGSSRIKTIEPVWELEGILGADYDGMLFYPRRRSRNQERHARRRNPRPSPVHSTDLETRQIFWMAHGGVTMLEAGNMLLVVVKAVAWGSLLRVSEPVRHTEGVWVRVGAKGSLSLSTHTLPDRKIHIEQRRGHPGAPRPPRPRRPETPQRPPRERGSSPSIRSPQQAERRFEAALSVM